MNTEYPLKGVKVTQVNSPPAVAKPVFTDDLRRVNQDEFFLKAPGVGCFYARSGNSVEYYAEQGADTEWVRLNLTSQVLVALLHQRKIINFHASSYIYNGMGVLLLGETGAGKSSLTTAFSMNGAGFLTDDLTPVIFRDSNPIIWPLYRAIKIDTKTISQLGIGPDKIRPAEKGTGKYYFDIETDVKVEEFPLNTIIKLESGNVGEPEFHTPDPSEKFSILRSEICSWDILAGMIETEKEYLDQLLQIIQKVKMVKVIRPADIKIIDLYKALVKYLKE